MKIANMAFCACGVFAMGALLGCSPHVELGRENGSVKGKNTGGGVAADDGGGAGGASGGATESGGTGGDVDNSGGVAGFTPDMPVVKCVPEPLTGRNPKDLPAPTFCPCTRRDGQGSLNCPVGAGKYAGAMIGPTGGEVVLDGTPSTKGVPVKLTIPYGALTEPHVITITETRCNVPHDFHDWSPVYQIDPPDLVFVTPASIELPFDAKDPAPNFPGAFQVDPSLSIYVSRGGAWNRVPDSYVNAGFSQATVSQLGSFFVGYPKPEEQLACP
jgi:hypothetical protein